MEKSCGRCKAVKPVDEFHRDRTRPGGRSSHCKPCRRPKSRERRRRWRENNRDKHLTHKATYRRRNRERISLDNAIRQAKATADRHGVETIPYTVDQLSEMFGPRSEWVCHYCGGPADSIDHIVPMAKGGINALTNLTTADMACNSRKGSRSALEYLGTRVSPRALVSAEDWADFLLALTTARALCVGAEPG